MAEAQEDGDFHKVKRISFLGSKRPIVMQNENGPCPLIGIGAYTRVPSSVHTPLSRRRAILRAAIHSETKGHFGRGRRTGKISSTAPLGAICLCRRPAFPRVSYSM
jgi:hypothetical protein